MRAQLLPPWVPCGCRAYGLREAGRQQLLLGASGNLGRAWDVEDT